jgi:hypothetical protein
MGQQVFGRDEVLLSLMINHECRAVLIGTDEEDTVVDVRRNQADLTLEVGGRGRSTASLAQRSVRGPLERIKW